MKGFAEKKKTSYDLLRLKTIIKGDRLGVSDSFDELVLSDLNSVLKDYFELKTEPTLSVEEKNGSYFICIEAAATRIKTFGKVPERKTF